MPPQARRAKREASIWNCHPHLRSFFASPPSGFVGIADEHCRMQIAFTYESVSDERSESADDRSSGSHCHSSKVEWLSEAMSLLVTLSCYQLIIYSKATLHYELNSLMHAFKSQLASRRDSSCSSLLLLACSFAMKLCFANCSSCSSTFHWHFYCQHSSFLSSFRSIFIPQSVSSKSLLKHVMSGSSGVKWVEMKRAELREGVLLYGFWIGYLAQREQENSLAIVEMPARVRNAKMKWNCRKVHEKHESETRGEEDVWLLTQHRFEASKYWKAFFSFLASSSAPQDVFVEQFSRVRLLHSKCFHAPLKWWKFSPSDPLIMRIPRKKFRLCRKFHLFGSARVPSGRRFHASRAESN